MASPLILPFLQLFGGAPAGLAARVPRVWRQHQPILCGLSAAACVCSAFDARRRQRTFGDWWTQMPGATRPLALVPLKYVVYFHHLLFGGCPYGLQLQLATSHLQQ